MSKNIDPSKRHDGFGVFLGLVVFAFFAAGGFIAVHALAQKKPTLAATPAKPAFACKPTGNNDWYRTESSFVIDATHPNVMYTNVEWKGFYKSTDGGKAWTKQVDGLMTAKTDTKTQQYCYQNYPVALIDPVNPNRLLLASASKPGTLKNTKAGGIYESTDAGKTWQQKTKDVMISDATALTLMPKDSKSYYYGTASGELYGTKDNGSIWEVLPTESLGKVDNLRIAKLFADPADANKLTATTQAYKPASTLQPNNTQLGVIQSTDAGKTWKRIDNLPSGYDAIADAAMSANNSNNMFITSMFKKGNEPASFYSNDGGKTFTKALSSVAPARYDPNDKSGNTLVGYTQKCTPTMIGCKETLQKSIDNGKTWTDYGSAPQELNDEKAKPKLSISNIVWHPTEANTLYLNGTGGSIWKSSDSAKTWTKLLSYDMLK